MRAGVPIGLAAVSVAMVLAARAAIPGAVFAIALACPVLLAVAAVVENRQFWRSSPSTAGADPMPSAASANAGLLAVAYGWGAATMLAIYPLTGLQWYHWGQYGAAMALIAALLLAYAHARCRRYALFDRRASRRAAANLLIMHAAAVAIGLAWLAVSGKFSSQRDDWAANAIFLAGGLALVIVSAVAYYTDRRLARSLTGA